MAYDELSRSWRLAYGVLGTVLLLLGGLGTFTEVYLARSGYPWAWVAAVMTLGLAVLGAYLLLAARRGRILTLGIGRQPPAS